MLHAIILGIVQGIAEFLPISSSGHLHLFEHFFGLKDLDRYIVFDLTCHLGSLLAILIVFFSSIKELFLSNRKEMLRLMIATLPLFPLVFFLAPIKAIYANPSNLGFFFLLTSFILFLGIHYGKGTSKKTNQWQDPLVIGMWQAVAIFPGVSRSGATISGARLLGWEVKSAMTFSFLLAIPTILGGSAVEAINLYRHPETVAALPLEYYALGFFLSFLTGILALKFLFYVACENKFSYFAWYCLFLGLATTAYFHLLS